MNGIVNFMVFVSVFIASYYWLADSTKGDPWPYVIRILPFGALMGVVCTALVIMGLFTDKRR